MQLTSEGRPAQPPPRRRGTERQVTAVAIALAGTFVGLAVLFGLVPTLTSLGPWLPVHLLLAGAASTAIAGVMPFFSAAVANAPPAPASLRLAGVLGVASGAALVAFGRVAVPALGSGEATVSAAGGLLFTTGMVAVGGATLLPLRAALGGRRFVVGWVYGVAVLNVVVGAALASLLLLGWLPVVEAWGALRPAHAWLNVFGFVSLVIAGSLLHLLPTVVGARISRTRAAELSVAGTTTGPLMCGLGFMLGSAVVAVAGALLLVLGAIGLGLHAVQVVRRRGRWTTDAGWHLFTTWSLVAAMAWFIIGSLSASVDVWRGGAAPAGWQLAPLIGPIGVGWVAQALIGAWSHLVPAVGPGSPERHSGQRRVLGRHAKTRLAALNIGVVAIAAGQWLGLPAATVAGGALAGATLGADVVLLFLALATKSGAGLPGAIRWRDE